MQGSGRNLNQSTIQRRRRGTALCWRAAGRWFDHLLLGSCCCALWITTDTLRLSCTWISVRHNEVVMLCISHSGKWRPSKHPSIPDQMRNRTPLSGSGSTLGSFSSMTSPGDPAQGVSQTSPWADNTSAGSFWHEGAAALLWAHPGSCHRAEDPQFAAPVGDLILSVSTQTVVLVEDCNIKRWTESFDLRLEYNSGIPSDNVPFHLYTSHHFNNTPEQDTKTTRFRAATYPQQGASNLPFPGREAHSLTGRCWLLFLDSAGHKKKSVQGHSLSAADRPIYLL